LFKEKLPENKMESPASNELNSVLSPKQLICNAIQDKQRVQFEYNGKNRVAEPQCCGLSTTGKEVARFHLIQGGSHPEQLFELLKIKSLKLLDEYFITPGPNYKKNDSAMKVIFCQL
jgi:hypothetical protein